MDDGRFDEAERREGVKLKPSDCLYTCYLDLQRAGRRLVIADCDARLSWIRAAVDLLAAVPDFDQRYSWAYGLATQLHASGAPLPFVYELMNSASQQRTLSQRRF